MRRDQQGRAPAHRTIVQQGQDRFRRDRIEVADRLVGEQEGGVLCQTARNGDPLALAATEAVGPLASEIVDADIAHCPFHGVVIDLAEAPEEGLPRMRAPEPPVQHVLADALLLDQCELLENEAGIATPGARRWPLRIERPAEHARLPAKAAQATVEQPEKGRFAGAGRADQRHFLAGFDPQLCDGEAAAILALVMKRQIVERDCAAWHHDAPISSTHRLSPIP